MLVRTDMGVGIVLPLLLGCLIQKSFQSDSSPVGAGLSRFVWLVL